MPHGTFCEPQSTLAEDVIEGLVEGWMGEDVKERKERERKKGLPGERLL